MIWHAMTGLLRRLGRADVTPPPAPAGGLGFSPLGTSPLGG